MQSVRPPALESLCSSKKHASYIARPLPGMKSLLPLRLLSPSPLEINAWPSLAINNRSTFGMSFPSTDKQEDTVLQTKLESGQESELGRGNCRSKSHRDIPIYTEPGSPVLSRAYLTDEDLHSSCNTSESDEWFEADECSCIRTGAPECFECSRRTEGPVDDEDAGFALELLKKKLSSMNRSSDLSFQCAGEPEAVLSDEVTWHRSALRYQRPKKPATMEFGHKTKRAERASRESWVSWLTDSSSGGEDDVILRATALAPAKTPPVYNKVNPAPEPTRRSRPVQIPNRSSSVGRTAIAPVHSDFARPSKRYSSHSSPPSPTRPWTAARSTTPTQSSIPKEVDGEQSKRSLDLSVTSRLVDLAMALPPVVDLAMTSPPESPKEGSPSGSNTPLVLPTDLKSSQQPDAAQSSNNSVHSTLDAEQGLSAESINDLLTALENLTSHFPCATLQPDTPAILAIRSQLAPPSIERQQLESLNGPPSPSLTCRTSTPAEDTSREVVSRSWSTKFSTHRRSASISISTYRPASISTEVATSPPHEFHVPHSKLYRALPPPNLQPLLRIFPKSSHAMCSSLYAYILAHIFTSSLSTAANPGRKSPKRQNTPVWPTIEVPTKAANILGMHGVRVDYRDIPTDELDWHTRVIALAETLRKSIACLISGMDPEIFQEYFKGTEEIMQALKFGLGSLFIRSLEEVVRSCEMNSTGYF